MRSKIPSAFELLMEPHIHNLDDIMSPGLSAFTWSSLKITHYIDSVYEGLSELELLIDRANQLTGIVAAHITAWGCHLLYEFLNGRKGGID